METLALKYRPQRFEDVVGQRPVRITLQTMVAQNKVPDSGLLFCGVRGTGKTTMGRIVGAGLNCAAGAHRPCAQCDNCQEIIHGSSLSVLELDAASNGNVGAIRELTDKLQYSVGGKYRVVLLDEAHSMSPEANNALLKTLEEPPPYTVFILLTTEPSRLLDTVISRLMPFEFSRISTNDIVSRLSYICNKEGFSVDPELLVLISERSQGGLRNAVMSLDMVTRVGVKTVEEFSELLGEKDFAPDLVRAMIEGSVSNALGILDDQLARSGDTSELSAQIVKCLTDILVIKEGGSVAWQGKALEVRRSVAAVVSVEKVFQALSTLWALKTQIRLGEDLRSSLELAVVVCTKALSGVGKPVVGAPASRRMSIAELQTRATS